MRKNGAGGGFCRKLGVTGAVILALFGAFVGYSYADDTVPDFFDDPGGAIVATFMNLTGQSRALNEPSWTVDPSTATGWIHDDSGVSTDTGSWNSKTTGRVWTDKTVWEGDATLNNVTGSSDPIVIENDDPNSALVSLSALSSAASITGTEVVTQPLDIILVLDASSYMGAGTPITNYMQVSSDEVIPTLAEMGIVKYAVQIDGVYHDVVYVDGAWHVDNALGQVVSPDTQQFYSKTESETTKLDVLKDSANEFVESVAHMNENLDDTVKHHLSVVQFGAQESEDNTYTESGTGELTSSTKVLQGLTVVDDTTKGTFTSAINGVQAKGNSSAIDLGMQEAQNVINQDGRGDAKKIVIVFTAGSPRHSWDQTISDMQIADPALEVAASLKDENGTDADIYTVGFFEAADSSVTTTWPNNLLQGISSNYPDAKVDGEAINLGGRDQTHDYYFNANSAEGLQSVFEALTQAIENNGKTPLEDEQVGGTTTPGYIEFTDTLGDFMEVKDFKSVVYAGTEFTNVGSKDNGDGTVTYTFTGATTGNHVYTAGDLSDIQITVSKSDTAKTGDVVTVRIPASLIPLRYYQAEVNKDSVSTDFSEADAYPIRVFYTVGVKDEVLKSLDTPGDIEGLSGVISDDKATFMTNQYASGNNGTTTAEFTPAKDNGFYYFNDENGTVIYSSPGLNPDSRVTEDTLDQSKTYYYALEWFDKSGTWHTDAMQISPNSPVLDKLIEQEGGYLAVPMGTERYSRAQDFESPKTENKTQTATNAISPAWGEDGTVTVSLGNNGKVTHTVPGNLDVSKTVDWGNGTPNADALFKFKVDIAGEDTVVPGDYTYTIYEGEGTDSSVAGGTIKDGGTIQLKHGQHVVIEDIPGGMTYTVTETVPAGFKTNKTETTDEETKVTTSAATGTIASKQTSDVAFTNTYTLQEATLEGNSNLKVTKTIDGRAWVEDDKFDFTLTPNMEDTTTSQAVANGAIKFGNAAATADSKLEVAVESGDQLGDTAASRYDFFDDITFTKPGVYQFVVQETVPADATDGVKNGITYTADKKIVTVTVTDDGDGTMTAKVSGDPLAFTNEYEATGKLENVAGTKTITGRDFKKGDSFTFNVTGSATTLDGGTFTGTVPVPNNKNTVTINPESGTSAEVDFGTITFTQEGIYTYTFTEQAPEGATEENHWTVNGITYDVVEKTIVVKVEDVDHNGTFKVTVTTPDNGNVASALAWNNTYKASPNTGIISGAKTMTGRDWLEGETYDFKLEPNNDTTVTAVKDGKIDGFAVKGDTIEPLQLENPVSANGAFSFSALTFKETGDYQFKITEVMPNGASAENKWTVNGVTYDSHTAIVNVTVTDPGDGKLKVEVIPSTEEGRGTAFTNSYEVAPLDYTLNLSGTKKIDDQVGTYELETNAFKFVLTPDNAAYPLPTGEGVARVDENDASKGVYVTNKAPEGTADEAAFQLAGTIAFAKEGTYTYTLTEDKTPQPGITFDQSVYHIAVTVEEDPATGTLEVTGVSVTKGDSDEAITDGTSKLDFTNTYSAGSVEGTVSATKNLSGRNFKPENLGGDEFTFAVKVSGTDAGGAAMTAAQLPKPANTQVTEGDGFYSYTYALTVTSGGTGESGTTAFNPVSLTYTRPGTYTFEISENDPTDKNITKDGTVYTVTVVVEEQKGEDDEPVLAVASTTVKAGDSTAESGVVFNNDYTATDTHSVEITKQLSGRAWDDDDEFTFTLKAFDEATKTAVKDRTVVLPGVENPTDGDVPASITIAKTDGVENVYAKSFEDITFNKTGTYKFLVQEQAPQGAQGDVYQGVNYDTNTRLVTITVSHDYQGGFEIKQMVTTQDGNGRAFLTFNNRYDASDAKLDDLAVTKTLTGREWLQGDEFSFELAVDADKDPEGVTATAIGNGNIDLPGVGTNATASLKIDSASTQAGDGTASKTATFDDITFKTEGTFYFKLAETEHNIEGVSHDNSVKHIKVEVEDNGDGQLIATSTVTDDNGEATTLTFTNTYTAKGFTTSFDVQKTFPAAAWNDDTDEWTGRDWTDSDTFQYKLALKSGDADGVQIANEGTSELGKPQSGTVGSVKLANVTFTKAGEYTFEVTETKPDQAAGVAYDTHTATITVQVEHDYANGTFKIAEGYPQYANTNAAAGDIATTNAAAFTNVYEPTTGTATLSVKKVLTGREWDADDSFTFTLDANDTTTQNAVAAGKIVLPQDATNGITVTDETEEHTDSFDAITFKAPGDYQFKISETVPADTDGVTYPTSPSIVNVNVRDNGEGQLVATVAEGKQTTTVTNMYGASGSLDGGIKVSKTLTGRDNDKWLATDSFTFSIAPENEAAKQAVEKQLIVLPSDVTINAQTAGHTSEFGKISFGDVEDGTYTFTVTENAVAANSGITPGGESYTVAIRVKDESGDGTLKVELLDEAGNAAVVERTLAFTNTYKAAGTLADGSITVEKVLTGRDWTGSDSFEFKLKPKSDNAQAAVKDGSIELPKNATDGVVVTNENNHQASFGAITFDDVADGDYVFTVTETSKSGDGITYAAAQDVTITVEDNDAGTLTLTPATTNLTFTNTYDANSEGDAAAQINATKKLTGRDMKAGEFAFEVRTNPTGEGAAESVLVATGTNAAGTDGTAAMVTFKGVDDKGGDKALTFDLASLAQAVEDGYATEGTNADGQRQWTLSYTATEKTDTNVFEKGVKPVNGKTSFNFTLTVTDNGQGALTVVSNTESITFENTYGATGTLPGTDLPVEKTLTGRDWTADDAFQFQIQAVSATKLDGTTDLGITAPLPTKTTINTKDDGFTADKDDATTHSGNFGDITYSLPGVYTYAISEVAPALANGITPDTDKTQVVVTVRDNGDGTLTPSAEMYKLDGDVAGATVSAARFTNAYNATDATETIDIQKTLTGRNWAADDAFTFTVTRTTDGAPMPGGATGDSVEVTVKPDAAATENPVTGESAAITFTKDDLGGAMSKEFKYTVAENATSNGVTKDGHTAMVTITVTDDGEGRLSASAQYDNNVDGATEDDKKVTSAAAFTNTYKAEGSFAGVSVTKTLAGRDWQDGDSFEFQIALADDEFTQESADKITLPGNVKISSADNLTAAFGDIKFGDVPDGDYKFVVSEVEPKENKVAGVEYSNQTYEITLNVADQNNGTLSVTVAEDSTTNLESALAFTNTYKATGELPADTISVTKDLTGRTWQDGDTFQFKIELDETGLAEDVINSITVSTDPIEVTNGTEGHKAAFGEIEFNDTPDGEYTFVVSEVVPDDENKIGGITYSTAEQTVKVKVTDDGQGGLDVTLADGQSGELTFENSYAPKPTTVIGADKLTGTKTLKGRDALENEVFKFTLEPADKDTEDATTGNSPAVVLDRTEANLTALKNGTATNFNFGDITFNKPGTYTFNVTESNVPGADANGMTYDRHTGVITIEVTDEKDGLKTGQLVATVTEGEDKTQEGGKNESLDFVNSYEVAEIVYGDDSNEPLGGSKTVTVENGGTYTLGEGDFSFTFTPVDGAPLPAESSSVHHVTETAGAGEQIVAKVLNTRSSDTEGGFDFGTITFDHAGTYKYYLTEDSNPQWEGGPDPSVVPGISYDSRIYVITIDVQENLATGTLSASASAKVRTATQSDDQAQSVEMADIAFSNTYKVGSVDHATQLTKQMKGRDFLEGDEFTFDVTLVSDDVAYDKLPQPQSDNASAVVKNNEGNGYAFSYTVKPTAGSNSYAFSTGNFTYTEAGSYTFTIEERAGDTATGIGYDTTSYKVEVTVVEGDNQTLTPSYEITKVETGEKVGAIQFVNTYTATSNDVAGDVDATKTLTGRPMYVNEFDFEIVTKPTSGQGTVVATGTNAAAGDGVAGKVTFASKDDTYKMSYDLASLAQAVEDGYAEVGTSGDGKPQWTLHYTAHEPTDKLPGGVTQGKVTADFDVIVVDNGNGTLTATSSYSNGDIAFTNVYESTMATPVATTGHFNKVIDGRDWRAEDAFSFTITPQGNAPAPTNQTVTVTSGTAKQNEKVAFDFGTIQFDFADIKDATPGADGTRTKDFVYTVTENDVDQIKSPNVVKDTHNATLTITVTDNGQGVLSVTKTTVTGNGAAGTDAGTFTNVYDTNQAIPQLHVVKTLTGRDLEDDKFAFTVAAQATDTVSAEEAADRLGLTDENRTFKNDAATMDNNHTATHDMTPFGALTFTNDDAGKTFTYTFTQEPHENGAGYTHGATSHTISFAVADDGAGNLTVTVTIDGEPVTVDAQNPPRLVFDSQYEATGAQVDINATKELSNHPLVGGEFQFNVTYTKGGQSVVGQDGSAVTATNTSDGSIDFPTIAYTRSQLNADVANGLATREGETFTYQYTVSEVEPAENSGFKVVKGSFEIAVKVTDDGAGNLTAEVVYPTGSNNTLTFQNAYGKGATDQVTISGAKTISYGENVDKTTAPGVDDIDGKFTFTLTGLNGAPMPGGSTNGTKSVVNDGAGNVDFGTITYSMDELFGATGDQLETMDLGDPAGSGENPEPKAYEPRELTFTYEVTESVTGGGTVPGFTTDGKKTITVKVTDNGDGTVTATKTVDQSAAELTNVDFVFTNKYDVQPVTGSVTDAFSVTKKLTSTNTSRVLRDGEFSFELVEIVNGVEQEAPAATGTNNANGLVTMSSIEFDTPGRHAYVLREVKGKLGGVAYDDKTYKVIANVTDNQAGGLEVAWSVTDAQGNHLGEEGMLFSNTYTASGTSLALGAAKVLNGRDLADGEFNFVLRDAEGNELSTASNTAEGVVLFDAISYTEEGVYDYTISEVLPQDDDSKAGVQSENVTYDETVFTVRISVTDNGEGGLVVSDPIYGEAGSPVFHNTYTEPLALGGTGGTPQTGDPTSMVLPAALAAGGVALVSGTIVWSRRRNR